MDYGFKDYTDKKSSDLVEIVKVAEQEYELTLDKFHENTGAIVKGEAQTVTPAYIASLKAAIQNSITELNAELAQINTLEADMRAITAITPKADGKVVI